MKAIACALGAAAAALFFALASCGGGGGTSVTGAITPAPATLRTDLLYGYFGGCITNVVEEAPHVNLYWATGWCVNSGTWFLDMAQELAAARGAGIKNVVLSLWPNMVWGDGAAAEAKFQFDRLAGTGALAGFDSIIIYPQDEPDQAGYTDDQVTAMVATLRGVTAAVPALAAARFAVVYNCKGGAPGVSAFDLVGCDDYDSRCGALTGFYATTQLRPGQQFMVHPAGASPWRQDPACFLSFAEHDPRVAAVVPFIFQTVTDRGHTYTGIRENGMRALYCQAGRTVVAPSEVVTCP